MATPCLVTGGSGFVGREIVRYLKERGQEIVILGRSSVPGYPTIAADLGRGDIDLRARHFAHVYHAAGLAHAEPHTQEEAERFTVVNLEGTRALLVALEHCRERPESFLYVSTVAVYGVDRGELLDETTERRATDPYGLSKRRAEDLVLEWGARHGVRTAVVRLPLVAGPGAPGNLGRMLAALSTGRYLGVGDGAARRSMVRLTDVVRVLPRMADVGGVFHLTDGSHPSFAELESAVAEALGRRPPRHLPTPLARAAAQAGDVLEFLTRRRMPFNRRTLVKMTSTLTFSDERARRVLGWQPTRVLDFVEELLDGVESAAEPAAPPPRGGRGA
jgi:nucleoside-diphosphate-sugar epimerase